MADRQIKREDEIDKRAEERFAGGLSQREQQAGQAYTDAGIDQAEAYANDPANSSKNIDALRQEEEDNQFGYSHTDKNGNEKLTGRVKLLKRLGPVGIITLLFGGGGGILMTLLTPGIALVHVKETVENKVNSMATVLEVRSNKLMSTRLLGGTNKAVKGLPMFKKYAGLSEEQVKVLKQNGIKIHGGTVDENGILRGVKSLEAPNGQKVTPRKYKLATQTNIQFRDAMRKVYPSRFASWNDKVANKVSTIRKWSRNPKSISADSGGDAKTNQKEFNKNLQETTTSGTDMTEDPNIDKGEYKEAIDDEVAKLNEDIEKGTKTNLSADPAEALTRSSTKVDSSIIKRVGKSTLNAISPFGAAVGACTAYKYERIVVYAAKVVAAAQVIKFASDILSVGDKIKAGEATANDVAMVMTMLYATNEYGKSFGDSAGWHYAAYGKTTSMPVSSPMSGSALLSFMTNNLRYLQNHTNIKLGGDLEFNTLKTSCDAVTSPVGQIFGGFAGVIIGIFTGGGATAGKGAMEEAAGAGVKAIINKMVARMTEKFTAKFGSREAFQATAKAAGKDLARMGATMGGFFVAGHLISKYLTPYLASLAAGTLFGGDQDGVAAMDTLVAGAGLMSANVAQQRGMMAMTKKQALAFNNLQDDSTRTYIADQKRQANPFDATNPYSTANMVGFTLSSTISPQYIASNPASLLGLPAKLISNLGGSSTTAYAAPSSADLKETMNECSDEDVISTGLATDPLCTPLYGFSDISMLENTTPDDVADWMYSHGYINDEGEPAGDYANYVDKCFGDEAASQVISPLLEGTGANLPRECWNYTDSDTYAYWHLYYIDNSVMDTMDNGFPEPTSGTSGGISGAPSGKFVIASFNIRHKGGPGDNGYASWVSRLAKASKTIYSNNIDVAGLQEAYSDQQSKILGKGFLGDNPKGVHYAKWPETNKQKDPAFTPNAVIYNSDKYEVVKEESDTFRIKYDGKLRKNAVKLKLKEKKDGGGAFYIINTHDPAGKGGKGPRQGSDEIRAYNARIYVDLARKLSKEGVPIFVTADFNSQYGTNARTDANCILSSSGVVKDTWEMYKGISGCASGRPIGTSIDRIYASKELEIKDYRAIPHALPGTDLNSNNGSDHSTIINVIDFGDNSSSATGSDIGGDDYSQCSTYLKSGYYCPGQSYAYQCTAFVNFRLAKHGVIKPTDIVGGNGGQITATLKNKFHFKVDTTPAVHSVMSLRHNRTGHTAMVSAVNKDGSIVVEEYNWTHGGAYDKRTIPKYALQRYIKLGMIDFAHTETKYK